MVEKPRRKKSSRPKGEQARIIKDLPVQQIYHKDDNCTCGNCQQKMKEMGKKFIRRDAVVIPPQVYIEEHIAITYHCDCHNYGEVKNIVTAQSPKSPISGSLASPSVLAWTIHNKFELSLPLYRQKSEWSFYGLEVSDTTLANWVNNSLNDWGSPIYDLLHDYVLEKSVLHADETVYQILRRSDGKPATSESRMWLVRTSHGEEKPIAYYKSTLTRAQIEAELLLAGFEGYLHTDGYQVYKNLNNVDQIGCWAHVRRKFNDVGFTTGLAAKGVAYCNSMFDTERKLKDLAPDVRCEKRKMYLRPLMDQFFDWLDEIGNCSGKLKTAVTYARNQKEALLRVLDDGRLQLSNNLAEGSIRPIAIGRKNYLFSTSEKGAMANAIAYTLIETAKLNGIIPYEYLKYLFTHLPNTDFRRQPELLEDFLPWSEKIKSHCRKLKALTSTA